MSVSRVFLFLQLKIHFFGCHFQCRFCIYIKGITGCLCEACSFNVRSPIYVFCKFLEKVKKKKFSRAVVLERVGRVTVNTPHFVFA